jgi:hypothetical protein
LPVIILPGFIFCSDWLSANNSAKLSLISVINYQLSIISYQPFPYGWLFHFQINNEIKS